MRIKIENPAPATLAADVATPDYFMSPCLQGLTANASQQRISDLMLGRSSSVAVVSDHTNPEFDTLYCSSEKRSKLGKGAGEYLRGLGNAKARSLRILIVEDDAAMARGLAERLKLSGFAVDIESDGASAAQTALLEPYRLIILDINLPNESGFEVLHKIRQAGSTVPVMILTARYAVDDKVSGLDLGADDYLSKPFDISEFDARVRALVRRGQGLPNPTLVCGPLAFDRAAGKITLSGKPLELRRREFAVLEVLMTRAGKLVPKERLIAEVFGFDEPVAPNAAELYVARVRQKLGPDGPRIRTVRGLGYLLEVL